MDSRIILSNADFSANNIGQYVEILDLTKKVLAKQTQYDESSAEGIALNTFLRQLINNGFIGGESPLIKSLIIPALASEQSQLLYDIAWLDDGGYPRNVMSSTEQASSVKSYVPLTDNNRIVGLKREQTAPSVAEQQYFNVNVFKGNSSTEYPSFSVVYYGQAAHINTTTVYFLRSGTNQTKPQFTNKGFWMLYGSSSKYINTGFTDCAGTGFNGVSFVHDGDNSTLELSLATGTYSDITLDTSVSCVLGATPNKIAIGDFAYQNRTFCSMLLIANYINPTKMAELKGYVDTLMAAIHVTNG